MTFRKRVSPTTMASFEGLQRVDLERLSRTVQEAVDTVPLVSYRFVRRYLASGTAGTEMDPILWSASGETSLIAEPGGRGPDVATIVRIYPTEDISSAMPTGIETNLNFRFVARRDGRHEVILFEPNGLTADTRYDYVVQFVGGVR